ncbi:MAG: helix-hairpin-helix domain-containing protein [Chloroflexota bacterium]
MTQNQPSTATFFAISGYTVAVFIVTGLAAGSISLVSTWWILLLILAVSVAFTGVAIREGREATSTALVRSPLADPEPTSAPPTPKAEIADAAPAKSKPAPKTTKSAPAPADEPDELTKLEGVGPKTSKALIAQGIDTFAKLAALSLDEIREALEAGGVRFAPSAESWAEQAGYAAKGDWDGLTALQDRLEAGRYPTED